jgi:hypothetical protein
VSTAFPYRPDRVNDAARRQVKSRGQFGFTGAAAVQGAALIKQHRTGGGVNGAIHPAATEQRGVGRIDNCVHLECCNICANYFNHGWNSIALRLFAKKLW